MDSDKQEDKEQFSNQDQNLTYPSPFRDTQEIGSDDDEQDKDVLLLKCKNAIEDLHYELEKVQNENHELTNKLNNLENDYNELQDQAKQTVADFEFTQQELEQFKEKNKNLQEKLQLSNQDNDIQKNTEKKYQDMKEKFQEMCDLNTMQKVQIEEQQNELIRFKNLQEEWQQTLDNVSGQTKELSIENEDLKNQIQILEEKLIQQENINRIVEDSNYEFKLNTQKLQQQVQELQDAIEQAELISKENIEQLDQKYNEKLNEVNQKNQELEQDYKNLQLSIEIQRKQFDEMQKKYQEKDKLMNIKVQNTEEELEQIKQLHNEEMQKLEKIIEEQNGMIQQYEMVVDLSKGQHIDKKYLTELAEKNGYLKNRLEECQKEIKKLVADMEIQFQNEDCKNDYLEKKVVELEVILQQREITIQQYQDELHFFKSKEMQTGQQIPQFQKNISDLQETLNVKDRLLSRINQEKTQLMHENRQFKKEQEGVHKQIEELQSNLAHEQELRVKQNELIKTFQEKSGYLEQVNNENIQHLRKELTQKDQQISELRHRYDSSVEKIIEQRQNIEEQGRQIWRQKQNSGLKLDSNKSQSNKLNQYQSKNLISTTKNMSRKKYSVGNFNDRNLFSAYKSNHSQSQNNDLPSNYKSVKFSDSKQKFYNKENGDNNQNFYNNSLQKRQQSQYNIPLQASENNYHNNNLINGAMSERILDKQYEEYQKVRQSPQNLKSIKDRENIKQFQQVINRLENKLETMSKGYQMESGNNSILHSKNKSQIF